MLPFRSWLLPIYAVATLFPRLLSLPGLPAQIQVTELLFPLLLWSFRKEITAELRRFPYLSAALLVYVLTNFTSAMWAGDAGAIIEATGRAYLAAMVPIAAAHCRLYGFSETRNTWKAGTILVAAVCLVYYLWVLAGGADPFYFTAKFAEYPYLGSVYRLRGTAPVYGMLYMLLLPGLWFAYEDAYRRNARWWPVIVIALAGLLTLGKENLLFPIGLCLYHAGRAAGARPRWLLRLAAAGLSVFLLAGTHYLVERVGDELAEPGYTAGPPVLTLGDYRLLETNYTVNKRAAVLLGLEHPWLGIGPGRFAQATEALVATGDYPAHFVRFDPHSAWTGAFAETGLLGLLALLLVVVGVAHYGPAAPLGSLGVILLLFLLTSIFKDVMNFRGVWLVVGGYLANHTTFKQTLSISK